MDNLQRTSSLDDQRVPGVSDRSWAAESYRMSARAYPYRLVLLLALVLLGLALLLTVDWPRYTLRCIVLRSPLTVTISLVWPMVGFLAGAIAVGVTLIIREYPALQKESLSELLVLWPLPALTAGLAALLLQRVTTAALWATGVAATGLVLCALICLEYVCLLERYHPSNRQTRGQSGVARSWADWSLQVLAYLLALAYFALVYQGGLRTLLSAPAIFVVGGLLAIRLCHGLASDWRKQSMHALTIGLILGEATWALNYWPGRSIIGGVLLLLVFYVLVGLGRRSLQGRLTRSAILEYGVVTVLGLGIFLRFG
jgi:hypothetical protein